MFLHRHDPGGSEDLPVTPGPQDSESSPTGIGPKSTEPDKDATRWHRFWHPVPPWEDQLQVVSLRRGRLEAASVEMAIVMRAPDGYVHRRMRCMGSDMRGALPHLVDPDSEKLARGGEPPTPRWVHDDHFETAQQALEAAQRQDPPADTDKWKTPEQFRESFKDELDTRLVPQAQAPDGFDQVVAGVAAVFTFMVTGFAFVAAVSWLALWDSSDDEWNFTLVVFAFFLPFSAAGAVYGLITGFFSRRNLAKAMKQ